MALMALPSLTPLQVSRTRELVEALEAHDACKPSSGSSRRKRKKRKKRRLPRVPRHGGRRPRGHAACVLAVLRVPGASVSVPRQSVGHSCYATETETLCCPWVDCYAPVVAQRQVPWFLAVACARLILLVFRVVMCSLLFSAGPDAWHHGRYGFLRPFVSDSHLFGVRPWSTRFCLFLEVDFRMVSVFRASWLDSGYMCTSVYVVVFLAGCDAPRAVYPCLSAFRRRQQWQCTAGFTGDEAPCAVFSFPTVRPKMRDIMASMDEKDREFSCCSSTSPLSLAVTCTVLVLPEVYRFMDCSGR